MNADELDLIDRSQAGDVQAFNLLVESHQSRLYTLCYRLLGNEDDAADAVQETLLSAYRNIRRFRRDSFSAWTSRIATNKCYDLLRSRQRRPQSRLIVVDEDGGEAQREFVDRQEGPDDRALRKELAAAIQRELEELPADQRVAVVLSDVQGYSYEEIAQFMDWPVGTVKSRLSRGRSRLREAFRMGDVAPRAHHPSQTATNDRAYRAVGRWDATALAA